MSALDSHGTVKHVSNNHNKCFPSNVMGQRIVNAVTGKKYDFCVGSKESLSLFKVIDTSGTYDKSGKKRRSSDVDKIVHSDPNHFYFDGPQEYAQHRRYHHNHITSEQWKDYQNSLTDSISGNIDLTKYHGYKNAHKCNNLSFVEAVRTTA